MKLLQYLTCWLLGIITMYFASWIDYLIKTETLRIIVTFLIIAFSFLIVLLINKFDKKK